MKEFTELTVPERAALTPDEVARYVRMHAAIEGVRRPTAPPIKPPPASSIVPRTVPAFMVGSLMFSDRVAAAECAVMLTQLAPMMRKKEWDWRVGTAYDWAEPVTESFSVDAIMLCERDAVMEAAPAIKAARESLEIYEKQIKAWQLERDAWAAVEETIHEECDFSRSLVRQLLRAREEYAAYLELAENNSDMARKFFLKAFNESSFEDWVWSQLSDIHSPVLALVRQSEGHDAAGE